MEPRLIARLIAAGRAAIGVGAILNPVGALRPWIGDEADSGGGQVMGRALGARDLVIGAGALRAGDDADALRPWLAAGILADCVDFGATAAADDLPLSGRVFILALAGAAAAAGAVALAQLDAQG